MMNLPERKLTDEKTNPELYPRISAPDRATSRCTGRRVSSLLCPAGYGGIQHCLIPAPKHVIIDKDATGDYTTKLFSKEQSYKSMLKILGY